MVYNQYEEKIGLSLKITPYEIDLEKAVALIAEKNYKLVVLQIPEGLKIHYPKFVEFLEEKTNAEIIISADPCYGACDVLSSDYKNLGVDFVIQIGHNKIPSVDKFEIPTIFLNAEAELDASKVIEKAIPMLSGKKIGLVTTAQHLIMLDFCEKYLTEKGFKIFIGKGDSRIERAGQILGCNFSSARSIAKDVDSFLFIGSGNFHALGLLISTKKPVVVCDPYTNEVRKKELDDLKDMILRQRYGAIGRSMNAKIFGIIISTKLGQQRKKLAFEIKEKLKLKQKKCYILAINHFSASVLESFRKIDCFVSTGCPRIAVDDYMQYKVPIVTPIELDIILGFKKWGEYSFDEILE